MKRRIISILVVAVMMLSVLTACGGGEGGSSKMLMATGGTSGTYYGFGGAVAQMLGSETDISVTAVATGASKENIQNIDAGNNQLGIVQNDVMDYAYNGTNTFAEDGAVSSFRTVAGLYAEQVQIVTMDPEIKSVADLAGKSVSIGAAGSGVYYNAIDVLGAYGLTEEDIDAQYLSFADSAESVKDGKIQAAFITAGAPTTAITELATSNDVYLVPIDDEHADALIEACPYYTVCTIPAGTYESQAEDIQTVTVKATLIVAESASEDDVYTLTKAIFENVDSIAHAKNVELNLDNAVEGISVPFHAGAAKYFAEQGYTVETK